MREGMMPFREFQTYYRITGPEDSDKTPLLLLHGGPGSTHNYFEVLDQLAEEDERQIVMYDQLGCGNSYVDHRPELWHAEVWVDELVQLRQYLGLQDVHILGQSWGGMLLLEYVCRYAHEGVRSLILSSTLPSSAMWAEEQHRMIRELPPEMQAAIARADSTGDYTEPGYLAAEKEYMYRHAAGDPQETDPECLRRPKRSGRESYVTGWGPNEFTPLGTLKDYDVTELLSSIAEPALVISGGNDLCTPYVAKYMYDHIPDSRWELFRDCRHMCFAEDTSHYIYVLKDWMNSHE